MVVPQVEALEVGHEVAVELQELARQGLALEQVAHLGLDALVAAGDAGDGGRGRDGDEQGVAQPGAPDPGLEGLPAVGLGGRGREQAALALGALAVGLDAPEVKLQGAAVGAGLSEGLVRAIALGQGAGLAEGGVVDLLLDAGGEGQGLFAVEGQAELEKDVLQAHQTESDRAPAAVARGGLGGRVVVDVNDAVEVLHGDAGPLGQLGEVEALVGDEAREVERAEVAHGRLALVRDLDDLGAEVAAVHHIAGHAGLVGLLVAGVLEGHPAVAGLGQGAHHPGVEVAGLDLANKLAFALELGVEALEFITVAVGERRRDLGVEQRPGAVLLHPLHEQVGHPVREVEVVGAPGLVAGVVAQLQELLDVGVPALEVNAAGALAAAALVDRRHAGVEGLEPGHDAVALAVGAADQAAAGAHPVPGHADAAGELGQAGDVGVPLVNALQLVFWRVEQVAGRHLAVAGAAVEQRGAARQVLQRGDQPVELDRLFGRVGQASGHAHEEVLRGLHHLAGGGVAQQVAVVDRLEAEVAEQPGARLIDGRVELRAVGLHQGEHGVRHDADRVGGPRRAGEAHDALQADLAEDQAVQGPGGHEAVALVLDDQGGGHLHQELLELAVIDAVVEPVEDAVVEQRRVDVGDVGGVVGDEPGEGLAIQGPQLAVGPPHPALGRRVIGAQQGAQRGIGVSREVLVLRQHGRGSSRGSRGGALRRSGSAAGGRGARRGLAGAPGRGRPAPAFHPRRSSFHGRQTRAINELFRWAGPNGGHAPDPVNLRPRAPSGADACSGARRPQTAGLLAQARPTGHAAQAWSTIYSARHRAEALNHPSVGNIDGRVIPGASRLILSVHRS